MVEDIPAVLALLEQRGAGNEEIFDPLRERDQSHEVRILALVVDQDIVGKVVLLADAIVAVGQHPGRGTSTRDLAEGQHLELEAGEADVGMATLGRTNPMRSESRELMNFAPELFDIDAQIRHQ